MKMKQLLSATALAGVLVAVPTAAFAQTAIAQAPATDGVDDDKAAEGDLIVSGSRIRTPNAESTIPITSLSGDELFQQG